MVTSSQLTKLFGNPSVNTKAWEADNMNSWKLPALINLAIPELPHRIYCHVKFRPVLEAWLGALIQANVADEINTYDGCWNVRKMRGLQALSIHSWGMAIDLNAAHNPLGLTSAQCNAKGLTPFSEKFIEVSRQYVDCGADWKKRPDGMHFQIKASSL